MQKYPLIASEGLLFLGAAFLLAWLGYLWTPWTLLVSLTLIAVLYLLFRDPHREIPSEPMAVVSPVDGWIVSISPTDRGDLDEESIKISVRINHFGAYTVRSPVEGKVLDLRDNMNSGSRLLGHSGMWVQTHDKQNIVLMFRGPKMLGRPASFVRYGERVGQGQPCAFVRLTFWAEIYVPVDMRLNVETGQRIQAGSSKLGSLMHKDQ